MPIGEEDSVPYVLNVKSWVIDRLCELLAERLDDEELQLFRDGCMQYPLVELQRALKAAQQRVGENE